LAVAIGCGGSNGVGVDARRSIDASPDSGIDPSKPIGSLSVADQMAVCQELAREYPKMTITCGTGNTRDVGTDPSECTGSNFQVVPASCPVTVGQLEDCSAAEYREGSAAVCSNTIPTECAPLANAGSACGS
jgi:hypothetical protein